MGILKIIALIIDMICVVMWYIKGDILMAIFFLGLICLLILSEKM